MYNNQKKVIKNEVIHIIERDGLCSLLDIGAGQRELAQSLAESVERYVAVESDPVRANQLRESGLEVVTGSFPDVSIANLFDVVLVSHSIPENIEEYDSFVTNAWELTANGGTLMFITLKGAHGDLDELRKRFRGEQWRDDDALKYKKLKTNLTQLGSFEEYTLTSYSTTTDIDKMLALLSFSIGGSKEEQQSCQHELREIVKNHYYNVHSGQFRFPHQHMVLLVNK